MGSCLKPSQNNQTIQQANQDQELLQIPHINQANQLILNHQRPQIIQNNLINQSRLSTQHSFQDHYSQSQEICRPLCKLNHSPTYYKRIFIYPERNHFCSLCFSEIDFYQHQCLICNFKLCLNCYSSQNMDIKFHDWGFQTLLQDFIQRKKLKKFIPCHICHKFYSTIMFCVRCNFHVCYQCLPPQHQMCPKKQLIYDQNRVKCCKCYKKINCSILCNYCKASFCGKCINIKKQLKCKHSFFQQSLNRKDCIYCNRKEQVRIICSKCNLNMCKSCYTNCYQKQ